MCGNFGSWIDSRLSFTHGYSYYTAIVLNIVNYGISHYNRKVKLPSFTLKLEVKLLIWFILVAIIPLLLDNIIWLGITKTQMTDIASTTVEAAANNAETAVDDFFKTKLIGLIIHSQTQAVRSKDIANATAELRDYLGQDSDLQDFLIVDTSGRELLRVSRTKTYSSSQLQNDASNPAFKVPTFGGGEKYISPLYEDQVGNILTTISIPIVVSQNLPNLQNLNTSAIGALRTSGEITGVLILHTRLTSLWTSLRSITINKNGYVFLVDSQGTLLFHPNLAPMHTYLSVDNTQEVQMLEHDSLVDKNASETVRQTINDTGFPALTTHRHNDLTRWGIVAQVPISEVFGSIIHVEIFGIILFTITLILTIFLGLALSKNIVYPIGKLTVGAWNFGHGNFSYRIHVRTRDELEDLAFAFNNMAINLQHAFQKLSIDKNIITAERNKLNFVLLNITDAIIALDKKRTIVIFNKVAERMTGYIAEEAIGQPISKVLSIFEDGVELSQDSFVPLPISPNPLPSQDEIIFKQKVELHSKRRLPLFIKFSSVVLKRKYDHELGFILTFHDITEELTLEKMKMDFVSIAAHELRTPLTVIKGYLSVLQEEGKTEFSDEQKMFMNRIERGTEQLTFLVENLLNVARIEKGTLNLNFEKTDWVALAKQITYDLSNQASDKHIQLTFRPPQAHIDYVRVDSMRIREVLTNLMANAINYTHINGTVEVSIEQKGDDIITHVTDTGIGIPKEAIRNLFTKFYRVSSVLTAGSKGTGLGLYIAKSIIELHKGKIWVESTEHQGSTFSFSLPADPQTS